MQPGVNMSLGQDEKDHGGGDHGADKDSEYNFVDLSDTVSEGDSCLHRTADGEILVPAGVLRGIQQISEGRTADDGDLEDALSF